MPYSSRRLTDPEDLRALAHPVRMSILEQLTVFGPLTASQLADRIDESPANCSWHLRKLAEHGFVEEAGGGTGRRRPWRAVTLGLQWNEQDLAEGEQLAGEALTAMLVDREVARFAAARQRLRSDDAEWREVSGSTQSALWLTVEELTELAEELKQLVLRSVERHEHPELRPPGSRLCSFMGWVAPTYQLDGQPITADDVPGPTTPGAGADPEVPPRRPEQ
ncbi:MAG TPA: helix-turn-helix domain-containing protein [Segeticoccus sp.]|nr:helix-turn-helix domain-containing protein [Segeticoccus sp.]